jgi:hypothetical protein
MVRERELLVFLGGEVSLDSIALIYRQGMVAHIE